MEIGEWLTLAGVIGTVVTAVLVVFQIRQTRNNQPPGGLGIVQATSKDDEFIVFEAKGGVAMYSVEFNGHGAVFLHEGNEYETFPPFGGISVVDVRSPAQIRLRRTVDNSVEHSKVEISWVSGSSRSNERERLLLDLETGQKSLWKKYRLQLWRKQAGQWVELKGTDGYEGTL